MQHLHLLKGERFDDLKLSNVAPLRCQQIHGSLISIIDQVYCVAVHCAASTASAADKCNDVVAVAAAVRYITLAAAAAAAWVVCAVLNPVHS